jgi:hypothetical protein
MERIYLPPRVGNSLGAITLVFAGFALFQTIEAYGDAKYFEGQSDTLEINQQYDIASRANDNIDELQRQTMGNGLITAGFLCVAATSFHLASNGRHRQHG